MIITTRDGKSFDTETDLTAPERHVLQKLFLWETMAGSLAEFQGKKDEALLKGWNNSGPVHGSTALREIIKESERKVSERLSKSSESRSQFES